jgi:hypothetical protein
MACRKSRLFELWVGSLLGGATTDPNLGRGAFTYECSLANVVVSYRSGAQGL